MRKVKILVASVLFCAMGYVGHTAHERDSEEYEMYVKDGFPRASKEVEDHIKNGGVTILRYITK